jgi:hypothetical protein
MVNSVTVFSLFTLVMWVHRDLSVESGDKLVYYCCLLGTEELCCRKLWVFI